MRRGAWPFKRPEPEPAFARARHCGMQGCRRRGIGALLRLGPARIALRPRLGAAAGTASAKRVGGNPPGREGWGLL